MNAVAKEAQQMVRSKAQVTQIRKTKQVTLASVAAEAMERAGGDVQEATGIMELRVSGNEWLFHELMTPMVREACYSVIRHQIRNDRKAIWTAPNYTKAGNGERLVSTALTLLDFRLPHNLKPLREAGKEDLQAGADWYETQAKNMQHKARWLRAVAEKVGNKTVGATFTAEKLAELQGAVV